MKCGNRLADLVKTLWRVMISQGGSDHHEIKKYSLLFFAFMISLTVLGSTVMAYDVENFNEDCTSVNGSLWTTFYNPPVANGLGQWVFNFPAHTNIIRQANFINFTSYGNYTVVAKMPPRISGCNGWFFLYYKEQGATIWQELDLAEIWGSHGTATAYDIALYVDGKQTLDGYGYGGGIGYWYPNVYTITGINFTDNQYHTWLYDWSESNLLCYLDGILFFNWSASCTNQSALGLPDPPMIFMIGGKGDGSQASAWSMTVDSISYEIPTPHPIQSHPQMIRRKHRHPKDRQRPQHQLARVDRQVAV